MSWSPELWIGEFRPWPDSVYVMRGKTNESVRYVPEYFSAITRENVELRDLCKWLLNPYRLGAVSGEGIDRHWCRETYDGGIDRLRKLGLQV